MKKNNKLKKKKVKKEHREYKEQGRKEFQKQMKMKVEGIAISKGIVDSPTSRSQHFMKNLTVDMTVGV